MTITTIPYTVSGHFLPALINGDLTGLDGSDEGFLERFEREVEEQAKGLGGTHWHQSVSEDEGTVFTVCEITDEYANCEEIELVVFKE